MIPLAGLANAFDAGYDAESGDIYVLEHTNIARTLTQISTDAAIYRSSINASNKGLRGRTVSEDNYQRFSIPEGGGGAADVKVARANLDGTNALVIASNDLTELDHIALDTTNQRVYFSEAKAGR
ncbi:hypothetical protein TELCIR_21322, partial [Teladorsagia circumcincta]